jgi:hypothetical protein
MVLERSTEGSQGGVVGVRRRWHVASRPRAAWIVAGLVSLAYQPQIVQAAVPAPGADRAASGTLTEPVVAKDDQTGRLRFSPALEAAIQQASEHHGVPTATLRAFAAIESSGNPKAITGKYYGVYQLSHSEFRKYGGRGNIFDVNENTEVAARKLRAESDVFAQRYGRAPTANELYMIHQQGVEGAAKHMANPDAPAWRNMHLTGEGRQRGAGWARLAIWGNVPTDQRPQFAAGVDSITSRQFMEMWARKMMRFGGERERVPGLL